MKRSTQFIYLLGLVALFVAGNYCAFAADVRNWRHTYTVVYGRGYSEIVAESRGWHVVQSLPPWMILQIYLVPVVVWALLTDGNRLIRGSLLLATLPAVDPQPFAKLTYFDYSHPYAWFNYAGLPTMLLALVLIVLRWRGARLAQPTSDPVATYTRPFQFSLRSIAIVMTAGGVYLGLFLSYWRSKHSEAWFPAGLADHNLLYYYRDSGLMTTVWVLAVLYLLFGWARFRARAAALLAILIAAVLLSLVVANRGHVDNQWGGRPLLPLRALLMQALALTAAMFGFRVCGYRLCWQGHDCAMPATAEQSAPAVDGGTTFRRLCRNDEAQVAYLLTLTAGIGFASQLFDLWPAWNSTLWSCALHDALETAQFVPLAIWVFWSEGRLHVRAATAAVGLFVWYYFVEMNGQMWSMESLLVEARPVAVAVIVAGAGRLAGYRLARPTGQLPQNVQERRLSRGAGFVATALFVFLVSTLAIWLVEAVAQTLAAPVITGRDISSNLSRVHVGPASAVWSLALACSVLSPARWRDRLALTAASLAAVVGFLFWESASGYFLAWHIWPWFIGLPVFQALLIGAALLPFRLVGYRLCRAGARG